MPSAYYTVYMVDLENVANAWTEYLPGMTRRSRVILFYTASTPTVPTATMAQLTSLGIRFEFVACLTGTNALDFQLCTELGYRVAQRPNDRYVIVSRDKGYDPVVSYWTSRDVLVSRLAPSLPVQCAKPSAKPPAATKVLAPKPADADLDVPCPSPSALGANQLKSWQKLANLTVNQFGHIHPTKRDLIIRLMSTMPGVEPSRRVSELHRGLQAIFGNEMEQICPSGVLKKLDACLVSLQNQERRK